MKMKLIKIRIDDAEKLWEMQVEAFYFTEAIGIIAGAVRVVDKQKKRASLKSFMTFGYPLPDYSDIFLLPFFQSSFRMIIVASPYNPPVWPASSTILAGGDVTFTIVIPDNITESLLRFVLTKLPLPGISVPPLVRYSANTSVVSLSESLAHRDL